MTEPTTCKKIHVLISGYTGPTGAAHTNGGRERWAEAKLYKIRGEKPMGDQIELIGVIDITGKDTLDCSAKIAQIAKEKYGVEIMKEFKKGKAKVEYVAGKRIELHDYKEVYNFVGRKRIIGSGTVEEKC